MNKQITFSNEEYTGYSNEEIKQLNKEIQDHLTIIKELQEKIKNIRSNCNHIYLFESSGPYEDYYSCKICGNETEK